MKYLIIILILQVSITNEFLFQIGCCTYEMDPFRGFILTGCKETNVETLIFEKDQISYEIIEICEKKFNALPSNENFERLKSDTSEINNEKCMNDCKDIILQLNENYTIKQEKNRMNEAKILKEKKAEIKEKLKLQIAKYSKNLSEGKSAHFGKFKYKPVQESASNHHFSLKNSGANKQIKKAVADFNKLELKNKKIDEKIKEITDYTVDTLMSQEEREFMELSLKSQIEYLDLEIMYFEKKNKKPLSFILDRFSMKDEILVKLIKIFEFTMEEVVRDYIQNLRESINFQFRVLNKYDMRKSKLEHIKRDI